MNRILSLPTAFLLAALTGCGGDKRADVSGKVTVAGKGPLTGGTITFISAADAKRAASGVIAADGSYRVAEVPVGECRVTVDNSQFDSSSRKAGGMPGMGPPGSGMPGMKGMPGGGAPGAKGPSADAKAKMGAAPNGVGNTSEMGSAETANAKYVKIDHAYATPEATPLKATVGTGSNAIDFEVK